MQRHHLFEFNDHPSAPKALKELIIESLSRTLDWGRMVDGLVPAFTRFVEDARVDEVLDLGAGAGGPARVLLEAMVRSDSSAVPRFVLTDLAPMPEVWAELEAAWPSRMASVPTPVDATAIDPKIAEGRARVIINVLHHFPPAVARGVFADAIAQGSPIFISESFGREPWQFLVNFPPTGIPALLTAPLLTPRRRLAKAALVWWTPLGALASAWDGLVSTLRVYEEDELRAMVASIPGHEQFRWVFGRYPYPPLGRGLFFYGIPHS